MITRSDVPVVKDCLNTLYLGLSSSYQLSCNYHFSVAIASPVGFSYHFSCSYLSSFNSTISASRYLILIIRYMHVLNTVVKQDKIFSM